MSLTRRQKRSRRKVKKNMKKRAKAQTADLFFFPLKLQSFVKRVSNPSYKPSVLEALVIKEMVK